MSTGFNSFNRSALGAFIQSPLKARGGEGLRILPVDLPDEYGYLPLGMDLLVGSAQGDTTQGPGQQYICPHTTSTTPATPSITHGRLNAVVLDTDLADPVVSESYHYISPDFVGFRHLTNAFTYDRLSPDTSVQFGYGALFSNQDTDAWTKYLLGYGTFPSEAGRGSGAPGCSAAWLPSTPPSTIRYSTAAAVNSYLVLSRADADSPFLPVADPYDFPLGPVWGMTVAGFNERLYVVDGNPSATIKYWPIETSYGSASFTSVTLPASTVYSFALWEDWLVVWAASGDVYCYWQDTLKETISADTPGLWDTVTLRFGTLVVEDAGTIRFYDLSSAGAVTFENALSESTPPLPCGDGHALRSDSLYTRSGGVWSNLGNDSATAVKEVKDEGYSLWDIGKGWALLAHSGLDPKYKLAQIY